jgi:hypothetical protein
VEAGFAADRALIHPKGRMIFRQTAHTLADHAACVISKSGNRFCGREAWEIAFVIAVLAIVVAQAGAAYSG